MDARQLHLVMVIHAADANPAIVHEMDPFIDASAGERPMPGPNLPDNPLI
jgi:hypothetical protein